MRVYKSGTPAAHLFAVMFAFKKPGGCQPLSLAVTETGGRGRKKKEKKTEREREGEKKKAGREREREGRGEVEKRAPLCAPFFQKSLTGLMPSLPCM